jgi:hypothetical protein
VAAGFCPYGPSKAAAEANTVIMSRDLNKTGLIANVLIPHNHLCTGMQIVIIADLRRQSAAKIRFGMDVEGRGLNSRPDD